MRLAARDPRIAEQYDWFNAVATLGTESSATALLRLVIKGSREGRVRGGGVDPWRVARQLAQFGRTFPNFRTALIEQYAQTPSGHAKAIIEAALAKLADPEIVLAMIQGYAIDRRALDVQRYNAVRDVAVGRRPSEELPGAYEVFGVSQIGLRASLFELMQGADARSGLAETALNAIEEVRDEVGRLDDEARHPLIKSDLPWPK